MIKRVNRKKHLSPRFDDFKEAAKLTYDLCVSLFCGYSDSVFFACLLLLFHEDSF